MNRIPEETIQAIRDRIDIVDLVGRYVALKKAGRSHVGLCPFHDEKTPSFHVSLERGSYHCFGCGEGGSAFSFLMRHDNLTFPEAVRALAREVGIEIPESRRGGEAGLAERLQLANDTAQRFFRASLESPQGAAARAYLEERGVDRETRDALLLGFAPDGWSGAVRALSAAGLPARVGERAGLLKARASGGHHDLLRGRITFPIQDARGRILGFGGRALAPGQQPKYLNTPESPIYRKRESFYGFPHALEAMRRRERVVVVEGYFDRIALHRAGIPESVATCGTALTAEHARNLRRRTREVVLLFDGDAAGRRAVESALSVLLPAGLRVRAVALPEGDDPDSLLRRAGPSALSELIESARPAIEVVIDAAAGRGCATPWEKADAVGAVASLLALVPDPVERAGYVTVVARAVIAPEREVEAAVLGAARAARPDSGGRLAPPTGAPAPAASRPRRADPQERKLRIFASALLEYPQHAGRVDAGELEVIVPDSPWRDLLAGLLAAAESGPIDVPELAERLPAPAGRLLHALAAGRGGEVHDEAAAVRTIDDTLRDLRRRHRRRARGGVRQQLGSREATREWVDAVQLLLEQRRRATTSVDPPG